MKIRIGKDINIRWEILTDGEPRPLEGRTLALYIQDYTRRRTEIPYTIAGNALLVSLRAAQLTRLGEYVLTLVENEDEEGQTAVDAKPAFTLVEYTTEEDDSPAAPELEVEQVRLETANLVRTAGGIQPEELFAGKPVVMEKGDIVPVMRGGELRPVRVPGTLHGKYKGVIHKAVPLNPKRGMAYIFRNGLMFFKSNQGIFREHFEFLRSAFFMNNQEPKFSVFATYIEHNNSIRKSVGVDFILEHPEIDFDYMIIAVKLFSEGRTVALFIHSDEYPISSEQFSYELSTTLDPNLIEMASNDYRINHGTIVFSGVPLQGAHKRQDDCLLVFRKKKTSSYKHLENEHVRFYRRDDWSRIDFDKKTRTKFLRNEVLRLFRCETPFRSSRNRSFIEIKYKELMDYM